MTNLKLGDKVKVVNNGQLYSTFTKFAENHGVRNYAENCGLAKGKEGVVIVIGKLSDDRSDTILAITVDDKDFIIGERGVELIQTPAQKAGLVIGKRYFVNNSCSQGLVNAVVEFFKDDGTSRPKFYNPADSIYYYPHVSEVEEYKENTTIVFDKILTQAQIDAIKVLTA